MLRRWIKSLFCKPGDNGLEKECLKFEKAMSTFDGDLLESWEAYAAEKERLANLKNVVGGKVYMPHYGQCEYNCLEELILELKYERGSSSWRTLFLDHIVQYNVRFRDCLRARGIEAVIRMLIEECPSLSQEQMELDKLRRWWKESMHEHIADYDIQCYPRDAQLSLCGCLFEGLNDIESQIELSTNDKYQWEETIVNPRKEFKQNAQGLHVGRIWQSYPTFDSSDSSDGRSYDNFIVRRHPITADDLKQLYEVKRGINACRISENIPTHILPVVYHDGDHPYILVAVAK